MNLLWKWFRYVLTDKNDNWDLSIILWFYAVGLFLYKATTQPAPFDFLNFGAGCAGVFLAGKSLEWLTERHGKVDITTGNVIGPTVTANQTTSVGTPQTLGE